MLKSPSCAASCAAENIPITVGHFSCYTAARIRQRTGAFNNLATCTAASTTPADQQQRLRHTSQTLQPPAHGRPHCRHHPTSGDTSLVSVNLVLRCVQRRHKAAQRRKKIGAVIPGHDLHPDYVAASFPTGCTRRQPCRHAGVKSTAHSTPALRPGTALPNNAVKPGARLKASAPHSHPPTCNATSNCANSTTAASADTA